MNDHANSFGSAAAAYERGRPGYPSAALDWLLPAGLPRVVDLGAGTGKLTRQIRDRGLPVTAVEPSPGMLDELARAVPGVPAVRGSAEDIPLPDDSADVVLVAQAWHWVDPERAAPEIARVLAPGGRLGLIWNLRDERTDWVRRVGEIIGNQELDRSTVVGAPFGPIEVAHFEWVETLGPDRLIDMVASRSAIILLSPVERAAVLNEVRRLAATHPQLVGRTEFALPYIAECARADLPR
ncbi:class I SAM-dependent methyltransferase [Paractinoplanes durhamensis]|uniref:Methyltransferase n=1 Tax=Paractinoplanes durhamensis TaxID=113563 RepID=A0ABQ3YQX5_9ACTN|nr:class I SAM-dependent methyltransferase [Actinoplanes durhamensis]GID99986.1 putative methyltransferase [Actinoplanes durhamensis]